MSGRRCGARLPSPLTCSCAALQCAILWLAPSLVQGTVLPGPLQKEASVRLTASCSTLLGGGLEPVSADYANLADASEALPQLAGEACRLAADSYCSAMRLQVRACLGVLALPRSAAAWQRAASLPARWLTASLPARWLAASLTARLPALLHCPGMLCPLLFVCSLWRARACCSGLTTPSSSTGHMQLQRGQQLARWQRGTLRCSSSTRGGALHHSRPFSRCAVCLHCSQTAACRYPCVW